MAIHGIFQKLVAFAYDAKASDRKLSISAASDSPKPAAVEPDACVKARPSDELHLAEHGGVADVNANKRFELQTEAGKRLAATLEFARSPVSAAPLY